MAKHRTKEEVGFNERLLDRLWDRYKNYLTENTVTITFVDLVDGGYKGSFPYTVPSSVGEKYMIKQLKQKRGESSVNKLYSIFKITHNR